MVERAEITTLAQAAGLVSIFSVNLCEESISDSIYCNCDVATVADALVRHGVITQALANEYIAKFTGHEVDLGFSHRELSAQAALLLRGEAISEDDGEYADNILSVFFGAIYLEDDAFQDWLWQQFVDLASGRGEDFALDEIVEASPLGKIPALPFKG